MRLIHFRMATRASASGIEANRKTGYDTIAGSDFLPVFWATMMAGSSSNAMRWRICRWALSMLLALARYVRSIEARRALPAVKSILAVAAHVYCKSRDSQA